MRDGLSEHSGNGMVEQPRGVSRFANPLDDEIVEAINQKAEKPSELAKDITEGVLKYAFCMDSKKIFLIDEIDRILMENGYDRKWEE